MTELNLFAEGYRVEPVYLLEDRGLVWWAYGPRGSTLNANFETPEDAGKACELDFRTRKEA